MVRFRQKWLISLNFAEKMHLIPTTNQWPFSAQILARLVDQIFLFIKLWINIEEIDFLWFIFDFWQKWSFHNSSTDNPIFDACIARRK